MKTFYKLFLITLSIIFFNNFVYGAKILDVYKYRQCDASWGQIQLGQCPGKNICDWGCALACMSMLLKTHGTDANPLKVNTFMNANNYWSDGCDMDWIKVCRYPGSTMSWASSPAYSLSTVKSQIDANKPVVVKVLLSGGQTHFIVVKGYNNSGSVESDFIVLDPLENSEKTLNLYNKQSLRLFNNVIINNPIVTCEFEINGTVFPAPPNEYKIWKFPPIPSNWYTLEVTVTNRNGNSYDIFLFRPNGDSTDVAMNVNVDVLSQPFNISANNSWFPNSGNYRLKVFRRTNPPQLWGTSQPFYISSTPQLTVENMPETLYVGQSATFTWQTLGGILTLSNGGWTNDIQIQFHQDTALNVLAFRPVGSSPYTFVVPSNTGGSIPGRYRISASNPPGSSIPPGYLFAFTNYFVIKNSTIGIEPISEYIPSTYKLYKNYPNPFNPNTKIKFDMPYNGFTKLFVYDLLGKEVGILVNEELTAGTYEVNFIGTALASGIYFYRIVANDFVQTNKMLMIK